MSSSKWLHSAGGLALLLAGFLSAACCHNPAPTPPPPPPPPVGPPSLVDPPATVKVFVMKTGNTKWIRVNELGVGVCKYAERCASSFSFALQNPHVNPTDEIHITTAAGDATCLDPKPPYKLTEADPDLTVRFDQACGDGTKAYWMYKIECVGAPGGDCGGVLPADPGVIIDGGPHP